MRRTLAKGGRLKARNGIAQQSDNTRITIPITNLPMDDSVESKFYRDLAALSAMTDEERAKEDFYNRAINKCSYKHTVAPTNIAARTGHIQIDSKTGDAIRYTAPTTVSVATLTEGRRMWRSPAFQLALAPMFDAPFMLSNANKARQIMNATSKARKAYTAPKATINTVDGEILTGEVPVITTENAVSITPAQWTAAQDAAIARGDMVEAQRLRDLHFMVNTPDNVVTTNWSYYPELRGKPQKLYHGTWDDWNIFNPNMFGETDPGFFGKGIYTTRKKAYAETYGDRVKELYGYAKNPLENKKGSVTNKAIPYFGKNLDMTNATPEIKNMVSNSDGVNVYGRYSLTSPESPFEEMVFPLHGKTIKSADAVTYDNNGVRIPLGERDNFNINDIRYAIPFTIGLGTAGYLNNSHKNGGKIYNNIKRRISLETL